MDVVERTGDWGQDYWVKEWSVAWSVAGISPLRTSKSAAWVEIREGFESAFGLRLDLGLWLPRRCFDWIGKTSRAGDRLAGGRITRSTSSRFPGRLLHRLR